MLCLKAALQLVGQAAHGPFERLQLLIKIGAQALKLLRLGQFFGGDFFVIFGGEDGVIRVGIRMGGRGGRFGRGLAFGQFLFLGFLHLARVIHLDLGLGFVLLLLLAALGRGLVLLLVILIPVTGGIGLFLFLRGALILAVIIHLIGVIAKLVAIAQIINQLAGKFCKAGLIRKGLIEIVQGLAAALFDKAAPQLHDILRLGRQVATGGEMADQISRRRRERRISTIPNIAIALAPCFRSDLGVDIASRSGHFARADGFAAGGFHRLHQIAGHGACRVIF